MSFARVIDILDESVGGPQVGIGAHRTFWRGLTRDQFVAKKVFNKPLVVLGDGAASNLVRSLRGQAPFGADLPEPPPGASMSRMPAGKPPVSEASVAFIETWIDQGCPEAAPPPPSARWRATNAPTASSRTDDIWFLDADIGWAVNSNGQILHTTDGFTTWVEQFHDEELYLRCIAFASPLRGWAGTLTQGRQLLETRDGGQTWTDVTLPDQAPSAICGLSVVDEQVIYASGTNYPNRPTRVLRTVDGGQSWQGIDMSAHADLLVDIHFADADTGWVVGGKATVANPTRDDVRAVVLHTTDGGATWTNTIANLEPTLPPGEWGWKLHFVNDTLGYVALESFTRAAILKTTDGGQSWTRIDVKDPQGNANLEGIGFLDEHTGWVGGWGSSSFTEGYSSATIDGGTTWQDANDIGLFINRFRFLRDRGIGYASGLTVYKYSTEEIAAPLEAPGDRALMPDNSPITSSAPVDLSADIPAGAAALRVDIWDRFGEHVRRLDADEATAAGTLTWDGAGDDGTPVAPGPYIVRISAAGRSASRIVRLSV